LQMKPKEIKNKEKIKDQDHLRSLREGSRVN
jgi:hypothetical protein